MDMSMTKFAPEQMTRTARWWRRARLLFFVLVGLASVGLFAVLVSHWAFGPGAHGMWRMQEALQGARWPSAIARGVFGVAVFLLWPRVLAWRSGREGWSQERLAATLPRDRLLIGAAIFVDVVVLNLPLWISLVRG